MLLLFPETVPGVVPEHRSRETKAFIYGKSADLALAGFDLRVVSCRNFNDYEAGIYKAWEEGRVGSKPFMVVEQDVVPPSISYLEEMARCPEPICVAPVEDHCNEMTSRMRYVGNPWKCSLGTPTCIVGATCFSREGNVTRPTHPEDDYAVGSGTGILKVGPQLTRHRLDLGPGFSAIDSRLYGWLAGQGHWRRTHIHWNSDRTLVRHNHAFCRGKELE